MESFDRGLHDTYVRDSTQNDLYGGPERQRRLTIPLNGRPGPRLERKMRLGLSAGRVSGG